MEYSNSKNDPIGIFDSGIGGLTVANAINRILPQERIVYFGDTAHLPYGDKSPDSITYYSIRISKFLQNHRCKCIIIACNSASAVAYHTIKDFFQNHLFVNAVDPLIQELELKDANNIGIIGTKATIDSKTYERKILNLNPDIRIHSIATPLLVPLIEKELQDVELTKSVLLSYLQRLPLENINTLLLACTHYPLIKHLVEDLLPAHINILDSAEPTARQTKMLLSKKSLLSDQKLKENTFYLSDVTKSFIRTAKNIFKGDLNIQKNSLWV